MQLGMEAVYAQKHLITVRLALVSFGCTKLIASYSIDAAFGCLTKARCMPL
jgi:hypothetical protein